MDAIFCIKIGERKYCQKIGSISEATRLTFELGKTFEIGIGRTTHHVKVVRSETDTTIGRLTIHLGFVAEDAIQSPEGRSAILGELAADKRWKRADYD